MTLENHKNRTVGVELPKGVTLLRSMCAIYFPLGTLEHVCYLLL
jgi:hypothetical protein